MDNIRLDMKAWNLNRNTGQDNVNKNTKKYGHDKILP